MYYLPPIDGEHWVIVEDLAEELQSKKIQLRVTDIGSRVVYEERQKQPLYNYVAFTSLVTFKEELVKRYKENPQRTDIKAIHVKPIGVKARVDVEI